VVDARSFELQAEQCVAQSQKTVSCCNQIDQCLLSDNPDEVDSAMGAIMGGASTLLAASRSASMTSEEGMRALCQKPSDFNNIVNTSYGALRARSCDNYKAQCSQACSAGRSLERFVRDFSERNCSPSNPTFTTNIFSENFRRGCSDHRGRPIRQRRRRQLGRLLHEQFQTATGVP
jgi:hypothetical protein